MDDDDDDDDEEDDMMGRGDGILGVKADYHNLNT